MMPSQISNKITNRRHGVATDRNGSEIRVGDTVKEVSGEAKQGTILHIFRAYAFLHNRDQTESAGVFVCRTNNVATIIAKGGRITAGQASGPDLTKMNPAALRGHGNMPPPPVIPKQGGRDKTIGQTVTIRQGEYKGLLGIVKDATETHARVELHTKGKTISLEKMKLGFREYVFVTESTIDCTDIYGDLVQLLGQFSRMSNLSLSGGAEVAEVSLEVLEARMVTPVLVLLEMIGPVAGRLFQTLKEVERLHGVVEEVSYFQNMSRFSLTYFIAPAWMNADGGRTPAHMGGNKTPAWGMDGSRSTYDRGNVCTPNAYNSWQSH